MTLPFNEVLGIFSSSSVENWSKNLMWA